VNAEVAALVFGALIVSAFSFERFNRPSYDERYELDKLVALLPPDQLRARRVVFHAFSLYLLALLVLYFLGCAFANLLQFLGFEPSIGAETGPDSETENSLGIPPAVSLSVALVMVGLAPTFPVLRGLEDRLRYYTHRIAGIPTRILENSRVLRRGKFPFPPDFDPENNSAAEPFLIPSSDWRKISHYVAFDNKLMATRSDFEEDLRTIFACYRWIADDKLVLSNNSVRLRFSQMEEGLRLRTINLIRSLDKKSGFDANGAAVGKNLTGEKPDMNTGERASLQEDWSELSDKVDELADDFCLLIALYTEHEIIVPHVPRRKRKPNRNDEVLRDSVREHHKAMDVLRSYVSSIDDFSGGVRSLPNYTGSILFWTICTVVLILLIWSTWPGRLEYELRFGGVEDWQKNALRSQLIDGIVNYCVPLMVALFIRDSGRISQKWINLSEARWPQVISQLSAVVALAWIVSMLVVIGSGLWYTALQKGWKFAFENVQVEYETYLKMPGVTLAAILLLLIDRYSPDHSAQVFARQYGNRGGPDALTAASSGMAQTSDRVQAPVMAKAESGQPSQRLRDSMKWAVSSFLLVGAIGAFGRWASLHVSARNAPIPRDGLDAIDGGLILYASLRAALIAFFVTLLIAEVLRDREVARTVRRSLEAGSSL